MSEDIGVAMMLDKVACEVGRLADAVEKLAVAPGSASTNMPSVPCPSWSPNSWCVHDDTREYKCGTEPCVLMWDRTRACVG